MPTPSQAKEDTNNFSWKKFWMYCGPGWLMSMAYLDPGNLEADLQNGAYTGYQLIWVLFLSTCTGCFMQILAARLGTCTGKHLAQICAEEYSNYESTILWILTELAIIGSDIQEIIGSAIAFKMLFGLPLWVGCILTGLDTFSLLMLHTLGFQALEAFFSIIIGTLCLCFFIDFGIGGPEPLKIIGGFVPSMHDHAIVQAVGTVGAIIMPHNIFLHSALVQTRQIDFRDVSKVREANRYFTYETILALFVSFLINLAVICVFAKGFYFEPCTSRPPVQTACLPFELALQSGNPIYNYLNGQECNVFNGTFVGECPRCSTRGAVCQQISLYDAGDAISNLLGDYARLMWAIGLLAAGQASTVTGTYAGQFVMEGFWNLKVAPYKRMLLTRGIALVPAILVAIASKSNISRSDKVDEWLNVLQSIQLPFALLPLFAFTSNERIMGSFKNSGIVKVIFIVLLCLLLLINSYLVLQFVTGLSQRVSHRFVMILIFIFGCFYFGFILLLVRQMPKGAFSWKDNSLLNQEKDQLQIGLLGVEDKKNSNYLEVEV